MNRSLFRTILLCVVLAIVPVLSMDCQNRAQARTISLEQLLGQGATLQEQEVLSKSETDSPAAGHVGAVGSALERVELQGISLAQEQIRIPFRRYVVKGSMDLGGKVLDIPEGCILDLENGRLKNGSVKMNKTLVTPVYGISKQRCLNNVKVSGDYYETLVDLWGEQSEPLFHWDTAAPKKVYLVDLKKFGITPGYQKRGSDNHYTPQQYDLMYNNGIGFTKAIRWAYDNGYDGIKFPKKDYCFTPRTTKNEKPQEGPMVLVQDYEKYNIDLGGGSYYLIVDSKKKSQHYALTPEKPYAQGGTMFFIAACINLQIHNGRMVGDRALRDYDDGAERTLENSRAFAVSGYCQNIRLHHLDMSDFMADGISCAQSGHLSRGYDDILQGIWRVYPAKAKPIPGNPDKSSISGYFKISGLYTNEYAMRSPIVQKIAAKRAFSINNNLGYTRLINSFHDLEVLTFNESVSTEKPLRTLRTSYLETILLNPDETGVRIRSRYDEGVNPEGFDYSSTISELISSHVVIENCRFHDNHRGGISGGSNQVKIRDCTFTKEHQLKNYAGKTIPLFLVGATNYHINFEDSFAKDLEVSGCSFSRTSNIIGKLLFGVYTLDFHDNTSDATVFLYNNIFSDIHDNVFKTSAVGLCPWRLSDYDEGLQKHGFKYLTRVAIVHDNKVGAESTLTKHTRTLVWMWDNRRQK